MPSFEAPHCKQTFKTERRRTSWFGCIRHGDNIGMLPNERLTIHLLVAPLVVNDIKHSICLHRPLTWNTLAGFGAIAGVPFRPHRCHVHQHSTSFTTAHLPFPPDINTLIPAIYRT